MGIWSWHDVCWCSFFVSFGLRGQLYSNFLASTVSRWSDCDWSRESGVFAGMIYSAMFVIAAIPRVGEDRGKAL